MATLLSELRERTRLDCDSMDLDFAAEFTAEFGLFADCTSNQVRETLPQTTPRDMINLQV